MGVFSSKARMPDENSATALKVKEWINKDLVVIFSKTYCPYCKMAKDVFNKLNKTFTCIELDRMSQSEDPDSIQDYLGEITGARSVPRVFINGSFVGGGTEVKALYEKGELQKMLA